MIKEAIDRVLELNRPETYEYEDRTYIRGDYKPLLDPEHPSLRVETLSGFCDYLLEVKETSPETNNDIFIHIESHLEVTGYLPVQGPFKQRNKLIHAIAPENIIKMCDFFGEWKTPETFIIKLKSLFVDSHDREWLITMASSLRKELSSTLTDNGVAQTINVKKGASLVSTEEMKNSVVLAPYRSFVEIEQIPSEFIFRLKESNGELVCALFEADGGFWKIAAAKAIKGFIEEKLTNGEKKYPIII